MRISILQTDIVWENKQENLRRLREKLETLRGTTEIVVLPETFSTGFSMNTAKPSQHCANGPKSTGLLLPAAILPAKQPRKAESHPTTTAHSSLRPKAILTITTNATSSGWGTRQNISPPVTGVPSSDIAAGTYCCLYAMTFVSRSGAAIRAMNTTS